MADLDYAKVTGRFGLTVGDTLSDVDDDPDTVWCDSGRVLITPLNTFLKVSGAASGPFTAGGAVIEAEIGPDGRLLYQGKNYLYVVDLTSAKVNPQIAAGKATHKVTFSEVMAGTTRVDFPEFTCRLTAAGDGVSAGGVNDLTVVAPVQPGAASPIYRGEQGTGIAAAAIVGGTNLQLQLTDGSTVDAGALPVGPGGSDPGVAGYIATPGSAVDVALKASYVGKDSHVIDLCAGPYNVRPGDDITTPLQSAINTLAAAGQSAAITFSKVGTYLINGPQQTGTFVSDDSVTTTSGAQTLPTGTLTVADTSTFPVSGQLLVGGKIVNYLGKTATTFTNCTGGTGAIASGTSVALSYTYSGQVLYPAVDHTTQPGFAITIKGTVAPSQGTPFTGDSSGVILQSNATTGWVFDCVPATSEWTWMWTAIMPIYENLTLRLPANPQCGGINNLCALRAKYERIQIDSLGGGWVYPLTGTKEGIAGPHVMNNADITFRDLRVQNVPIAVQMSENFTFIGNTQVDGCNVFATIYEGSRSNHIDFLLIGEVGTVFKAMAPGAPAYIDATVDHESYAPWPGVVMVDDPYGFMINGTIRAMRKARSGFGWKGSVNWGIDLVDAGRGDSTGYKSKHPIDTFARDRLFTGWANGAPGTTDSTLHPWRVLSGDFNAPGGTLNSTDATVMALAALPVYRAATGGVPRSITSTHVLPASGSWATGHFAQRPSGSGAIRVELRGTAAGGDLNLVVGPSTFTTPVAQAAGIVTAGASHTIKTELYYDHGVPVLVRVWLDGILRLSFALTATQQSLIAVSTTSGPYLNDGLFFDHDTASTCTLFRVADLSPGPVSMASGTATLAAGTVVILDSRITASSIIRLSRQAAGGTLGQLSVVLSASSAFRINSSSNTDTSTVFYEVVSY